MLIDSITDEAVTADILVVDGMPVVCYQNFAESKLYLVSAEDADGAAWGEPYVVSRGIGERTATLNMTHVNGEAVICYAYYLDDVAQIRSVSLY